MFEKESEEYAVLNARQYIHNEDIGFCTSEEEVRQAYQKGAEFGYNKANEWHKVADGDLPKENKLYLVQIKDNGLAIAYFNGLHWETRYNLGDFGHCVETVIAWREIPTFEE